VIAKISGRPTTARIFLSLPALRRLLSEDHLMKKIHFTGEWFDCRAPQNMLSDPQAIQARCNAHMARRHLPISYEHFTIAESGGVMGAMTGHGIHIVLRAFPDSHTVKADLYADQGSHAEISAAMQVFDGLRDEFRPMRALLHRVQCDARPLPAQGRTPRAPTEVFAPLQRAV
jgi:hypothetical protein